jgi:predicted neutral ceramidase superfamily lipid hydrolase
MDDEPDFGGGMPDLRMLDFSGIGQTFRMLSWLPAIITAVSVFFFSFLAQAVYKGLTQGDYNITYGAFMMMILASLLLALILGAIVKVVADRRMKRSMSFGF